jgi:hypothetical protein
MRPGGRPTFSRSEVSADDGFASCLVSFISFVSWATAPLWADMAVANGLARGRPLWCLVYAVAAGRSWLAMLRRRAVLPWGIAESKDDPNPHEANSNVWNMELTIEKGCVRWRAGERGWCRCAGVGVRG